MSDPFDTADKVDLTPADEVDAALFDLGRAISHLGQAIDATADVEDITLERRAEWLSALEPKRGSEHIGLYKQLATVTAEVKRQIAGRLPFGEQVETSSGVLKYSGSGGSVSWDWPKLKPVLAAQIADEVFDRETGEIPPLAVVCERAINAFGDIVSLTASKRGKTSALEARGLKVKDYVTTTGAEPSVRFL